MYLVIFQLFSVGIWCWWLPINEMVASLFTAILHSEVNLTELALYEHIVCIWSYQQFKYVSLCHVIDKFVESQSKQTRTCSSVWSYTTTTTQIKMTI